ncbi:MAG: FAD-dependent oxidoreductase [Burkholderia gladioli]
MNNRCIVIIGSGLGGYSLAQELRRKDDTLDLTLVTEDAGASYSKPLLSNAIALQRPASQWIAASSDAMAARLNLKVMTRERVMAIDAAQRRIETASGRLDYDALILATGAEPATPPLAGDAAGHVISVNHLNDYVRFREAIEGAQRVLVIGAGLIGCEFANDLLHARLTPIVVDPGPRPLAALAPAETGLALQRALAAGGVQWRFGQTVKSIVAAQPGYLATLANGDTIAVDAVLSATGLRARTALARHAGLRVERGIVVDRYGRTSDPHIHALGDCAEYPDGLHPFVRPILIAAKAMAATLTGTPTPIVLPVLPVTVKTPLHPVIVLAPEAGTAGSWHAGAEHVGADSHLVFRDDDGNPRGFSLGGASAQARAQALLKQIGAPRVPA